MDLLNDAIAVLAALPGVREGNSRVGNPNHRAWFRGSSEFAHLHNERVIDLRLPARVQAGLKGQTVALFRESKSPWLELCPRTLEEALLVANLVKEAWQAAEAKT